MPEGPEVRRYADALNAILSGRIITSLEARTREARVWLGENEGRVAGNSVERVVSHGKHLIGYIESEFFFHSHLMMWGRWVTFGPTGRTKKNHIASETVNLPPKDRRERARIVVEGGAAILLSAPIFNVGQGNPYEQYENLATLGPDALPVDRNFDEVEFRRRLLLPEHQDITIGAALLNQRIVAGLGNYLRAEILFACRLDPWRKVRKLTEGNLRSLVRTIPRLTRRSYQRGATVTETDRRRMTSDPRLVYQPGREPGTRHLVFRRTNLPCLRCGETIRQLRQTVFNAGDEELSRVIYFCGKCQNARPD